MRIAITGAAGGIGSVLNRDLDRTAFRLTLVDLVPVDAAHRDDRVVLADLRDLDSTVAALDGVDAVVHLAAKPFEGSYHEIVEKNLTTTYHVYEAARRLGIRRVVFASSVHVNGFDEWGRPTGPADEPRPDTFYGLSKLYGEGLGRMYADRFGIEVVNLRIVGFAAEPTISFFLWGWLSHGDAVRLVTASLTAPGVTYLTCYGVSANTRRFYADDGWAEIGYRPVDDAETFAAWFPDATPPLVQGGEFAEPGYFGERSG